MPDPMASHLYAAQEEDVAFLIKNGTSLEDACARVGVEPKTLHDRLLQRAARA